MSGRNSRADGRPYNPAEDPYFIEAEKVFNRNYTGSGLAVFLMLAATGFVSVRIFGWLGLIILLAVIIMCVAASIMVRRFRIRQSVEAGFINRHNQVTRECITPLEKRLTQRFYKLECLDCGKSANVQATGVRRHRCPHCRVKKGGNRDGR